MGEELDAIRDCLLARGLVSFDEYAAALHRRRFMALLESHPLGQCSSLGEVCQTPELVTDIVGCLRSQEAVCLRRVSRAIGVTVQVALQARAGISQLLFCAGGGASSDGEIALACCDAAGGPWHALAPIPSPLRYTAAAVVGQQVYVCGGIDERQVVQASAICFDSSSGHWEAIAPMIEPRCCAAVLGYGGCLYAFGGELVWDEQMLSSAERFAITKGQWEILPDMARARSSALATPLNGSIYVYGGLDACSGGAITSIERLDLSQCIWDSVPPIPTPRDSIGFDCCNAEHAHPYRMASVHACAGCLYVCGGCEDVQENPNLIGATERFDPSWRMVYFAVYGCEEM